MMIASNLGQILGRMIYGELELTPRPRPAGNEAPTPQPRPRHRQRVLELIDQRGGVSCGEIAVALELNSHRASILLVQMYQEGKLARTGQVKHYVYTRAPIGGVHGHAA
jgi:hypothetical protein